MSSPRKESQFGGAAAMFRKKENEVLKNGYTKAQTPKGTSSKNMGFSSKADSQKVSDLAAPPFVSPGLKKTNADRPSWTSPTSVFSSSSYLDKPFGTPTQASKAKLSSPGFGRLPFTPSPTTESGKPKVDGQSWKDKPAISFQATSPRSFQKTLKVSTSNLSDTPQADGSKSWRDKPSISFQAASPQSVKKKTVTPPSHFGGSYLKNDSDSRKKKNSDFTPLMETPDIKIEVKIPDIDKKIKARKAAQRQSLCNDEDEKVPEHIRKFRQREANIKKALELKEYNAACKLQAYFLGWKARVEYPKIRAANAERLRRMAEERRLEKLRNIAAITIQKTFRGYLPRKRFLFLRECKRRRERNQKEIKRIEKEISRMPKKTKADIKEMKKEYDEKKKAMKKKMKNLLKEDEAKLAAIQKSGQNMIQYLQEENKKVREQQQAFKNDYKVLEKQFELLTQKSEEIARNFKSLQAYVQKKNAIIQKHEIASQKCRHRYLPKYRAEIADRNKHCVAEYRVKELYKKKLQRIIEELKKRSSDPEIIEEAQEALDDCENELKAMPDIPVPEGLLNWFQ